MSKKRTLNSPLKAPTRIEKIRHQARRGVSHPAGIPVIVFLALAFISAAGIGGYIWHRHNNPQLSIAENVIVIVKHDGRSQAVPTNARTVGEVLKRMNITYSSSDRIEPSVSAPVTGDNFLINVYRAAPIAIADGGSSKLVHSAAATARSIAEQNGYTLYAEDRVDLELTTNFVRQGSVGGRVVIDPATPVSVQLYGRPMSLRTQAKTVGALLKEKGVKLSKDDTVTPKLSDGIVQGMRIAVVRNGIQTVTIDEEVPAPVQTVIDPSLSFGSQAVRQEGSPGKVTNTYEITVENGREVSRKLLQSVKVSDPVTRIVAKGNTTNIPGDKQAVMAAAGIGPSDYMYVDYIFSRESHWNAAVISANGKYAGLGQTNPATLAGACPNWQNDPVCQTRFFSGYAERRYGSWANAYSTWQSKGWW